MFKKLSITTLILLLLSITVSFAWMMDIAGVGGEVIQFKFDDSIYLSPTNLQVEIFYEKNGAYEKINSSDQSIDSLLILENCAPGDVFKFSIKLNNLTDFEINTAVSFTDIESTNDDLYNHISIGVFSTNGFDSKYKAPEFSDFTLASNMLKDEDGNLILNEKNSVSFINSLKIPPMGNEVEFKFFVRFDHSKTDQNHLQNQTLTIGKINFVCF